MRFSRLLAPILGAILVIMLSNPAANAGLWNRKTIVTFNQRVQIPGGTLAPGTYVFKLLPVVGDRNTVQVFSEHESRLIATLHTATAVTGVLPDNAYFTLDDKDRDEGLPPMLQSWFFLGDKDGRTFVYSDEERQPSPFNPYESVASAPATHIVVAEAQ